MPFQVYVLRGGPGQKRLRSLSGLSPRRLLPTTRRGRGLEISGGPVGLVHGELSYVRQDLNGEFINDPARIPRARESIAFAAGHVFNPGPELLGLLPCSTRMAR